MKEEEEEQQHCRQMQSDYQFDISAPSSHRENTTRTQISQFSPNVSISPLLRLI